MGSEPSTIWDRLALCVETLPEPFTSAQVRSWFERHYPGTNEKSLRTHIRGAAWNVDNRFQFESREPFLTRLGHGTFRRATPDEVEAYMSGRPVKSPAPTPAVSADTVEWHTEAKVQALLVAHLEAAGWEIVRTADTATKEHGVDVVARRRQEWLGAEVKGYPSKGYADPRRAGETKRTSPATQARHWYAQAVLAAMKLRTAEPKWASVIALPDFPTYRALWADTRSSLDAAAITVWFVQPDGAVALAG